MHTDCIEGFVFPEPGVYRVRMRFVPWNPEGTLDGKTSFVSEPLEVTVAAPAGREAEAARLWLRGDTVLVGTTLEGSGASAGDHIAFQEAQSLPVLEPAVRVGEVFDTLRAKYPDTIYGQYARFYAAGSDQKPYRKHLEPKYDPVAEAIAEYEALLQEAPQFPLRDELIVKLAEAYRSARDPETARKLLERFMVEAPESPMQRRAEELFAQMSEG